MDKRDNETMNEELILESFLEEPESWTKPRQVGTFDPHFTLINIDARWGLRYKDCFTVEVHTVLGETFLSSELLVQKIEQRLLEIAEQERIAKFDQYFERQKEIRDGV